MNKGKLYLIPTPLGPLPANSVLSQAVIDQAKKLSYFVAENAKSARAFLKTLPTNRPIQDITIQELNEKTPLTLLSELITPLQNGLDMGLISEAGCPAVADPGAHLIALAHKEGIRVCPLAGPSSIVLALMGSGLSGQNFAFHGYLPIKNNIRRKKISELEKSSCADHKTQIFIETPYRNNQMLKALVETCMSSTKICIASNLTLDNERIMMFTAKEWRCRQLPDIDRQPTVFLLQA